MVRELIKDLENIKGAFANNYKTFPVVYGEKNTKKIAVLLLLFTCVPIVVLLNNPAISYMKYYFFLAIIILFFVGFYLWKSNKQKQYTFLHNILKILLLIGVFSLVFIDTSLLLEKVIDRLH